MKTTEINDTEVKEFLAHNKIRLQKIEQEMTRLRYAYEEVKMVIALAEDKLQAISKMETTEKK